MGRTHLRALRDVSDVGIVAVTEPVVALREQAVAEFDVVGYATLEDMLASNDVDGVLVVTPSDSHVEVISQVAAACMLMHSASVRMQTARRLSLS